MLLQICLQLILSPVTVCTIQFNADFAFAQTYYRLSLSHFQNLSRSVLCCMPLTTCSQLRFVKFAINSQLWNSLPHRLVLEWPPSNAKKSLCFGWPAFFGKRARAELLARRYHITYDQLIKRLDDVTGAASLLFHSEREKSVKKFKWCLRNMAAFDCAVGLQHVPDSLILFNKHRSEVMSMLWNISDGHRTMALHLFYSGEGLLSDHDCLFFNVLI